ncbi:uncharacterized protein LOC123410513 isoform X2 [Hordeum vulgare subsp. vulgare]|uniref:uncharacterized protein LOC123410513 isoform X2 n=1 Tax=Hordeum vulgare subsp. vulgare TaxID=112509 RepID=UPI001D1A39C4|nr:uncharacterized protein LOC123410513 isoform X2 [Hordeum vulgare subsp. vulgare]
MNMTRAPRTTTSSTSARSTTTATRRSRFKHLWSFNECPHPTNEMQHPDLSRDHGLEARQIKFWFQNQWMRNMTGRTTASFTWRTTRSCARTSSCARCSGTSCSPTVVAHPLSRTTSTRKNCSWRNLVSRMSSTASPYTPTSPSTARSCRYRRAGHKCLSPRWTCPWVANRCTMYQWACTPSCYATAHNGWCCTCIDKPTIDRSSEETYICGMPSGIGMNGWSRDLEVRPVTWLRSSFSRAFSMRSFCSSK